MPEPTPDPVGEAMQRVEASLSRVPDDAVTTFQSVGAIYDEATGPARLVTKIGAMRSSWNESLFAADLRLLLSALSEAREDGKRWERMFTDEQGAHRLTAETLTKAIRDGDKAEQYRVERDKARVDAQKWRELRKMWVEVNATDAQVLDWLTGTIDRDNAALDAARTGDKG